MRVRQEVATLFTSRGSSAEGFVDAPLLGLASSSRWRGWSVTEWLAVTRHSCVPRTCVETRQSRHSVVISVACVGSCWPVTHLGHSSTLAQWLGGLATMTRARQWIMILCMCFALWLMTASCNKSVHSWWPGSRVSHSDSPLAMVTRAGHRLMWQVSVFPTRQ